MLYQKQCRIHLKVQENPDLVILGNKMNDKYFFLLLIYKNIILLCKIN